MRLYQLLLAIMLAGGVSYFAGSALPDTAGGVTGHLLTFGAATVVFSGLFIAGNRYKGCGCSGSTLRRRPTILSPDVRKQVDKMTSGGKVDQCMVGKADACTRYTSEDCTAGNGCRQKANPVAEEPKPPKHSTEPDHRQVIGVRQFGSGFRNEGNNGEVIEVKSEPQEDGSLKVVVTFRGYTNRQFKERIRPRVEKIQGIRWQNPKNLGDNQRQMEGIIATGINATAVLSALECIK